MKTIWVRTLTSSDRRFWRREVQWLGVVGVLLILDLTAQGWWVRSSVEHLLQPIQQRVASALIVAVTPIQHWQDALTAQRRAQLMASRYTSVAAEIEELAQLRAENQLLRSLVASGSAMTTPRVLSVPITAYGLPGLAVGSDDGVAVGNLVMVNQVLVGRVSEVTTRQATVELLSNRLSQPVLVRTSSGVEGLLRGDDRRLLLTEVPIGATVTTGERVVTVGQPGVVPGLLVGEVSQVGAELSPAATQAVVVDPLVSFYQTPIVEVRL